MQLDSEIHIGILIKGIEKLCVIHKDVLLWLGAK